MYIEEQTLDDILHAVYSKFTSVEPELKLNHLESSKGPNTEIIGAIIVLNNPRARLSRTEDRATLFSCLGEFLWYLSGKNLLEFINYYIPKYKEFSDDGVTVHGGYGPRIFNKEKSQFQTIIDLLKRKESTRQAIIQIFDKSDLYTAYKDIPCTCTMQFFIRNNRLDMVTHMRSNDVYKGLAHDIFAFTMIQELLCSILSLELGVYRHFIGSLHIYDDDKKKIEKYLSEGYQSTNKTMPKMPPVQDFEEFIRILMYIEAEIRENNVCPNLENPLLNIYWQDICRLLHLFKMSKEPSSTQILTDFINIKNKVSDQSYHIYMQKLEDRLRDKLTAK